MGSQLQVPVSARKAPCPEHWSMQEALGLSHPGPPHPTKQWHSPWTHTPRPEHVGSRQSTKKSSKEGVLDTPVTCCLSLSEATWHLYLILSGMANCSGLLLSLAHVKKKKVQRGNTHKMMQVGLLFLRTEPRFSKKQMKWLFLHWVLWHKPAGTTHASAGAHPSLHSENLSQRVKVP